MDQELDRIVKAVDIASDPAQKALHNEALQYLNTIQSNAAETWRLALSLFVDLAHEGTGQRKYSPQTRFFALRVLDEFLDERFESLSAQDFEILKSAILGYIQSEFLQGSSESSAPFLRNKFSHTLTLLFLCTYTDQWTSFFTDIFTLISTSKDPSTSSQPTFNRHVSLLFFHLVLEISGEVADQIIKAARQYSETRHARDTRVRDLVRERDAPRINEAVLTIISDSVNKIADIRKGGGGGTGQGDLLALEELVDLGTRTFGSYAGWIDINLTVTPVTVPLLFGLLSHPSLPIRLASCQALTKIVAKGLKEPSDKISLFKVLSLGEVVDALQIKTRQEQADRGEDGEDLEETYREALGRLLNIYGLELVKLVDESSEKQDPEILSEAFKLLAQALPIGLQFLADVFDDTSSTVFPMFHSLLLSYKRAQKASQIPIDESKRAFLVSLMNVILQKMRYDVDTDFEDQDEDDQIAFETIRKELRTFLDAILVIDNELVINAIHVLALNTLQAHQSGVAVKWNDAELAVYLVFIFGEINKSGAKGRTAYCIIPVSKDQRKIGSYSDYPLTTHGTLLLALVQSRIYQFPKQVVAMQYYETIVRYAEFVRVRKDCLLPTLEAFMEPSGLLSSQQEILKRMYYLFHRFIKDIRVDIPTDIAPKLVDALRGQLSLTVEVPESDVASQQISDQQELLALIVDNPSSFFGSQIYLFESLGSLASVLHDNKQVQTEVLETIIQPLINELSISYQASTQGNADAVTIAKVHHIIVALGNVARGFPDLPHPTPPSHPIPPLETFNRAAQAILVSLESMNSFRVVRDASRSAFARIIATSGPNMTSFIPPLMANLLTRFEPSELADFINFIGLLIHQLQADVFAVLDELIGPLSSHTTQYLAQASAATEDRLTPGEVRKSYLGLLNGILASKTCGVFTSQRNIGSLGSLFESMLSLAENMSDPPGQKSAFMFFARCVSIWGAPQNDTDGVNNIPGFDQFIYDRVVPVAFGVISSPLLNLKDPQLSGVLHEVATFLQNVCKIRGQEGYDFFTVAFLPSQGWPSNLALEFTTKLKDMDSKAFRKYFNEFIRTSREAAQQLS